MVSSLKHLLGQVPAAATVYDVLRPLRPRTRYNLEQLRAHVPQAAAQARASAEKAGPGTRIMLFATLHYWIEQAVMIGLALRGMGHDVTVAYLPYSNWQKEINAFDLRRQDLYTRRVVEPLQGLVRFVSLLDMRTSAHLPDVLEAAVANAAAFDTMYSLQVEEIDRASTLFRLRVERNRAACLAAMSIMTTERPEAVLIPNGLVTELGVVYQVAKHLDRPTVTYEFNDQREQIWIAQNDIVMHQNTDALWQARSGRNLTDVERERIAAFEDARSRGQKYGKGTRLWQDTPAQGGEALRRELGLDSRPIVVLATNVLGDSLTLGRHVFAASMAQWIERTVRYFVDRQDVQLIIRVHPGERLIKGPSILRVLEQVVPVLPEHIHVVGAAATINTYDLMELADLGLAYTTTVGLEIAMRGIPVIVAGETHYRGRGFTMDPASWGEYFASLNDVLSDVRGHRLGPRQREVAWNYAYRFFFEYPFEFPWRLMHFWRDVDTWPLERVLSDEGKHAFGRTFAYLAGENIQW